MKKLLLLLPLIIITSCDSYDQTEVKEQTKVEVEKEKTKQLQLQWKIDSLKSVTKK